ncbi:MAG: hypothetical protein OEW67_05335 [Cyclobacteriaceae bacterium]|nr:hypothetical protein [Cyclobacteriaceae bacterium]
MAAIIIVALMVLMHMDIVVIKALEQYKFWLMVVASSLLLISSR